VDSCQDTVITKQTLAGPLFGYADILNVSTAIPKTAKSKNAVYTAEMETNKRT